MHYNLILPSLKNLQSTSVDRLIELNMHTCPHIVVCTEYMWQSAFYSRQLPSRCSTLVPVTHGSESVDQQHQAHVAFLLRAPVLNMAAVLWQSTSNLSIRVFPQAFTSHVKATILTPVASPYERLLCLKAPDDFNFQKIPFPLSVRWRHVSLDLSDGLVVLDQYFQQFESPVEFVSDFAELVCADIDEIKIWGQNTQFR